MKRTLRILLEPLRRLGINIGRLNTFLILSISFYVVLFPVGLLRRLFSPKKAPQGWTERKPFRSSQFEKQF